MDMPYIQFIGPGIIVMALINNAYTNVSSSFFSSKNHRFYEEMFVTPVPSVSIVLGYLSGGVLEGAAGDVSGVDCCLSVQSVRYPQYFCATPRRNHHRGHFSALGMVNAILAGNHEEANWVNNFVITPLTYMGGVFFPMTSLPLAVQPIAEMNPILMVVSSFRYGILGIEAGPVVLHLSGLIFCAVGLVVLLIVMIDRRYRLGD